MTDYPRQSQPTPKARPATQSAYDATDDKPRPKVPVRIVKDGRDALSGLQKVEEIEAEPDAAQDWDDRLWSSGDQSASSPFGPR
ncbi:hypothetical protein AB0C21_25895 [Spirillospora sp. NPDC049024]